MVLRFISICYNLNLKSPQPTGEYASSLFYGSNQPFVFNWITLDRLIDRMTEMQKNTKQGGYLLFKRVNGRLLHLTDPSRVKFRTNISKAILAELTELSDKHDTHINYLLETGLNHVLEEGVIVFNKSLRPKDRVQYKTSYDKELIRKTREFAKNNGLCANDVIEYSVGFIDIENTKRRDYRSRIEKM